MTNQIQDDYKALHAAAITLGTRMLASMTDERLEQMEAMTRQGAKLMIEIELPSCKEVALVLREIEGTTWPVCKLGTQQ